MLKKISIAYHDTAKLFKDYLLGDEQRLSAAEAYVVSQINADGGKYGSTWMTKLREFITLANISPEQPKKSSFLGFFSSMLQSQSSIPGHPLAPHELAFVARIILLQKDFSFQENAELPSEHQQQFST